MNIAVVMGGPSAEHEVSLATGREILANLSREKYRVRAVVISKNREFYFCDATATTPSLEQLASPQNVNVFTGPLPPQDSGRLWSDIDAAILGLHGEFGEDGLIQGFLDTIGVAYTGSGVFASATGMNKIAAKQLFEHAGLTTPPWSLYGKYHPETTIDSLVEKHGFPCFIKCPQSGSSRLMGRAQNREELEKCIGEFSKHSHELLIESSISGEEYSCPVIEHADGTIEALPPILIKPVSASFFDYTAKYSAGASEEIVPAPCAPELTARIQKAATITHTTLNCKGLTRTDIIVADDTLYVLEINTLPGLTPASLAPKAFAATGKTYAELLDILINTAQAKRR